MRAEQIKSQVKDFIFKQFFLTTDNGDLAGDTSFLESGIVDSTGIIELVAFLEETYRITIEDDDLVPSNLDSLNNIASFVTKKLGIKDS